MAITISGSGITSANIADGTIVNADVNDVSASKLTGALPAISAASLTSIPAGNLTGALPAISGASLTNLPGGGKVLQMVSSNTTSGSNQDAGSSWGDLANMTITITPTASTSTIHFTFYAYAHINGSQSAGVRVLRGSTVIKENINWSGYNTVSGWNPYPVTVIGTDTPNTTSATTYKLQVKTTSGTCRYFESDASSFGELTCIAIEIGA
jgi:hypothetical protein